MFNWYKFTFLHPAKATAMAAVMHATMELKKFTITYSAETGVTTLTMATKLSIDAVKNACKVLSFYEGIDFDHALVAKDYEEDK